MKLLDIQAAIGTAILLLSLPCNAHQHGASHMNLDVLEKRHSHNRLHASPRAESLGEVLEERQAQCVFPTDAGLVAVTPGSENAGWAMSPNQPCLPNNYCPYACPPGQISMQWDPAATSYTYPESMYGGLFCDSTGAISKPFPNEPYCVDGVGSVAAVNDCGSGVAFCQTVLPGNEAMLIPTEVNAGATVTLAVPGVSYWCSTAAHYYVNPPGYTTAEACIWSDGSLPIGNWAPYVAGANTDDNGNTYVKIGWNPIWTSSNLGGTSPTFGLEIECSGSGCNGLPCSINPSVVGIGGVTSPDEASGAGGADFCVVTVPSGGTADIVVFPVGGSSSASSGSSTSASSTVAPTSTQSSSSATPTTTSKTSSSSTITSFSLSPTGSANSSSTSSSSDAEDAPHILFQNITNTGVVSSTLTSESSTTSATASPVASTTKKSTAAGMYISSFVIGLGIVFAFAGYYL